MLQQEKLLSAYAPSSPSSSSPSTTVIESSSETSPSLKITDYEAEQDMGVDDMSHASGFHPEIDLSSPLPSANTSHPHPIPLSKNCKSSACDQGEVTNSCKCNIMHCEHISLQSNHRFLSQEARVACYLWQKDGIKDCHEALEEGGVVQPPHNLSSDLSQEEDACETETQVERMMRKVEEEDLGLKNADSYSDASTSTPRNPLSLQSTAATITSLPQSSSSSPNSSSICYKRRRLEEHQSKGAGIRVSCGGSAFTDPSTQQLNSLPESCDLMICGVCKSLFTSLPLFVGHKKSDSCRLRFVCHCRPDAAGERETCN